MKILEFKRISGRGSLLGFARVELASGMIISDVTIMAGEHGPWASPPSKPMINREGLMKDQNGKLRYQQIIEFTSKQIRNKFSDAVIAALRASNPEAFR